MLRYSDALFNAKEYLKITIERSLGTIIKDLKNLEMSQSNPFPGDSGTGDQPMYSLGTSSPGPLSPESLVGDEGSPESPPDAPLSPGPSTKTGTKVGTKTGTKVGTKIPTKVAVGPPAGASPLPGPPMGMGGPPEPAQLIPEPALNADSPLSPGPSTKTGTKIPTKATGTAVALKVATKIPPPPKGGRRTFRKNRSRRGASRR